MHFKIFQENEMNYTYINLFLPGMVLENNALISRKIKITT